MGYHKKISVSATKDAGRILNESRDAETLKRAQAIYCRAAYGMGAKQIAEITGYDVGTVRNLHSAFLKRGMKIFDVVRRGGRRNAGMSVTEEAAFVASFDVAGKKGGILEVSRIHRAHCEKMGRIIALSTTYDLLHRHGWRKVAPRSRHPKADQDAQAAFKKMA